MEGCLVRNFRCTPAGKSGGMVGWKISDLTSLGDPEVILVRNVGTAHGWGNQTYFWVKNVKVRTSGERMEISSGGPNEDGTGSNGWSWDW